MLGCRGVLALLLVALLVLPELVACSSDPESSVPEEEDDDWEDLEDDEDNAFVGSSKEVARAQKALPQLNDQNAERILNSTEYVFVLGYAPWCKQSAAVMVDFAEAAAILAAKGSRVALVKIDAIANQATANRYKIKGFPSLLFFTNGSAEIYMGGPTRDDFVNWVQKRTGQAGTTFETSVEAEQLRSRNSTVMVGLFHEFEGPEYEEFMAASVKVEDVEFLQTTNPEAAKVFSVHLGEIAPAIGIWKSEPENFLEFGGELKSAEVVEFIAWNKHALVSQVTSRNVPKFYASPVKKQVLLFANIDDYESIYPMYLAAAKDYKGELLFLWVDVDDDEFSRPMMNVYGISGVEPTVAGFDNNNGSRYLLEDDVTNENLKAFATEFKEGRLKQYYKSEPIPKKVVERLSSNVKCQGFYIQLLGSPTGRKSCFNNKADVKVVVGKTFEKLVLKSSSKDVLLLVYTPYCYDCDSMGKVFVKLAKHFKGVSSIIFAKFDAGANEHPELQVNSYPSVLLYRASSRGSPPVHALSKPNLKKLVQFVEENHVQLLSAPPKDYNSKEAVPPASDPEPKQAAVKETATEVQGSASSEFPSSDSEVESSDGIQVEPLNTVSEPSVSTFESPKVTSESAGETGNKLLPPKVELFMDSKTESGTSEVEDEELQDLHNSELSSHDGIQVEPLNIVSEPSVSTFESPKVTSHQIPHAGETGNKLLPPKVELFMDSKTESGTSEVEDEELQDLHNSELSSHDGIQVEPLNIVSEPSVSTFESPKVTSHQIPHAGETENKLLPPKVELFMDSKTESGTSEVEDEELQDFHNSELSSHDEL